MTGLTLSTCTRELPPATDAPEWAHLLPAGQFTARDGRAFDLLDPGAVILAFQGGGVDLPVDFEHANDRPEVKAAGRPIPAAGWIKSLANREDGLWARIEWTATARAMIAAREYRFISPAFLHDRAGRITCLKGAGLVHNPALHLTALASQDPAMTPDTPAQMPAKPAPKSSMKSSVAAWLIQELGLPEDATEEDALDALKAWLAERDKPDPKKFVPVEAVAEMLRDRSGEKLALAEVQATEKVDRALRDGFIPPALRDWALSLCRSDAGSFDAFLAKSGPVFGHLARPLISGKYQGDVPAVATSDEEAALCRMLGLPPDRLAKGDRP